MDRIPDAAKLMDQFRDAIKDGDVSKVLALRWGGMRHPAERDLLSDLSDAQGLGGAVRKLARFWQRADVAFESVRFVGAGDEAEVYERLSLPGEEVPIVSLLRRDGPSSPWQVVCTNEANDERFVLWVTWSGGEFSDVAWSRRFAEHGERGELLMEQGAGVLGHPDRGWLAHVRGPVNPPERPSELPASAGEIFELAVALSPDATGRPDQLRWLLAAGNAFLTGQREPYAYLPGQARLILPMALAGIVEQSLRNEQVFRFWSRVEETEGFLVSQGLHLLGLPEIEAPLTLLSREADTVRLLRWLGSELVAGAKWPGPGTELVLDDRSLVLQSGRRGPRAGKSYGRWGALGLSCQPDEVVASGRRIQVPESVHS